jgi:hypothetical protein
MISSKRRNGVIKREAGIVVKELLTLGYRQWALVIAGISDFYRPAENLSVTQNAALTATGVIWTRWCLIIKPKNYLYVSLALLFFFFNCGVVHSTSDADLAR